MKTSHILSMVRSTAVSVSHSLNRGTLQAVEHSPKAMFAGGLVGMIGTTVLASRATLKLNDRLDDIRADFEKVDAAKNVEGYSSMDQKRDKVVLLCKGATELAKLYAPAIVLGGISIALLTKSHNDLLKRNAAVVAAYASIDEAFKKYRKRVRDELGDEKDLEFRHGKQVHVKTGFDEKGNGTSEEVTTYNPNDISGYAKIFDEYNKNWQSDPEYNRIFLETQQSYMNDLLKARGHLFLSEVYDALGFDRTRSSVVVGWVMNSGGDNFVDFGLYNTKSERARAFINGHERSILLDFNVDGVILDKIQD